MFSALYYAHFLLLCTRLSLAFFSVASAGAQCPRPPVLPAFAENIVVETNHLPDAVRIRIDQPSPLENVLEIRNSSPTPLYVLAKPSASQGPVAQLPVQVPLDLAPAYKIVDDQAYAWQAGAWQSTSSEGITIATPRGGEYQRTDPAPLSTLIALAPGLEDRNIELEAFAPPHLSLPAPQRSQLTVVYGDQILVVPLTLTYEMNSAFVTRSAEAQSCTQVLPGQTPSAHVESTDTSSLATAPSGPTPAVAGATSTPVVTQLSGLEPPPPREAPPWQPTPPVLALLTILAFGVIGWIVWRRRR